MAEDLGPGGSRPWGEMAMPPLSESAAHMSVDVARLLLNTASLAELTPAS